MSDRPVWCTSTALPKDVQAFYARFCERLSDADADTIARAFGEHPARLAQCHFTLDNSRYVREQLIAKPELLAELLTGDTLSQRRDLNHYRERMRAPADCSEAHFDSHLRRARNAAMVRIIWRDFNRLCSLEDTMRELSDMAQGALQTTLEFHYRALVAKHGTPRNRAGEAQPMLVLGMGKLGACELNLSSDIDLIFAYPDSGHSDGQQRPIDNQEFFSRLGKKLIAALDRPTADGFVFRVDMRLRPYGQSGPLVSNFDALEDYYQTQGREWERYAMIKARVVAHNGAPRDVQRLSALLNSFTYRKYVDFSVIDALRKLKLMIAQEVHRRQLHNDVKLGSGGIREIEFIAQVFQLIRGGRDVELQDNRLLHILPLLEAQGSLPPGTAAKLSEAYRFLRNCEHAIQGYDDCQSQRLPDSPELQAKIAAVMGFADWDSFYHQLNCHRGYVAAEFATAIAAPKDQPQAPSDAAAWIALWWGGQDRELSLQQLAASGHEDPSRSLGLLDELRRSVSGKGLHSSSRERLDQFMPLLLASLSRTEAPSETLYRILKLVSSVTRRSAYLLLLIENPGALAQLIRLTLASPWIADRLAEHPALLDELLDQRSLYQLPSRAALADELRRSMLRIAEDDLEQQMDALRYFRSAHALRVAACEISNALPLMQVSDYLTWLAEAILDYTLGLCWQEMVRKHGYPDGQKREGPGFIIVGYGKLGGIELGHGSDLDLVFIHNAPVNGFSDGERSIDNQTFYMRLGQKVIHVLATTMASGQLYEVDMRLRPSGNSGMLVTSIDSFHKYQEQSAWTWEHQALVRARVVAGDPALAERFRQVRLEILARPRDLAGLQKDVVDMRRKMRQHLGSKPAEAGQIFHLKQDAGGIVDIEFMVQYGVLAWTHADPALATYTDNIRILESFANSNLLDAQEVDQLIAAYKAYRSTGHRLALQQLPSRVDAEQFASERHNVTRIWQRLLGEASD